MKKTSYDKSYKFTLAVPGRSHNDVTARIKVSENDEDQKILVVKVAATKGIRDIDGDLKKPGAYKDFGAISDEILLPKVCDASQTSIQVLDGVLMVTVPKFAKFVGSDLTVKAGAPVVDGPEAPAEA